MKRFLVLVSNEFRLARTALPIHLVAILQPTVLFLLMSVILVHPTQEMYLEKPDSPAGTALLKVMSQVRSPIGPAYIQPVLIEPGKDSGLPQLIQVEGGEGNPVARQTFGLIDSNRVKNYRNRLTAAALVIWDQALDKKAVTINQHPWLPEDVPYKVYFGMAMLPFAVFLAGAIVGSILTAQDFEFETILEYRLAPTSSVSIVLARLLRLTLTGLLSGTLLLIVLGLMTGYWPDSILIVYPILFPVALTGGCLGLIAGLIIQHSIPSYQAALVGSLTVWLLGGAFDLAAAFGGWYERVSRLTPTAPASELLFNTYFKVSIADPYQGTLILTSFSLGFILLASLAYRSRVLRRK